MLPISQTLVFVLLPYIGGWSAASRVLTVALLSVILTLIFAKLSWTLVEKPFLRLRKRFI